jgi:hypothetical protein
MENTYLYRDVLEDYIINLVILALLIYLLTFTNFINIKKI